MLVSTYDLTGSPTGGWAAISLVQPYAEVLAGQNNRAGLGAAEVLDRMASTPLGLTGAMAPTFAILDSLDAPALRTPSARPCRPRRRGVAGDLRHATRAAADRHRPPRRRLRPAYCRATAERNVWLKPLGGVASQSGNDGAPGYRASGGGLVAGVDAPVSSRMVLGGLFSYAHQNIAGSDETVPTARPGHLSAGALWRLRAEARHRNRFPARWRRQPEPRQALALIREQHGRRGLRQHRSCRRCDQAEIRSAKGFDLPSLRLDYAQVRADAYGESGAGGLNLKVDQQLYRELMLSAA